MKYNIEIVQGFISHGFNIVIVSTNVNQILKTICKLNFKFHSVENLAVQELKTLISYYKDSDVRLIFSSKLNLLQSSILLKSLEDSNLNCIFIFENLSNIASGILSRCIVFYDDDNISKLQFNVNDVKSLESLLAKIKFSSEENELQVSDIGVAAMKYIYTNHGNLNCADALSEINRILNLDFYYSWHVYSGYIIHVLFKFLQDNKLV